MLIVRAVFTLEVDVYYIWRLLPDT